MTLGLARRAHVNAGAGDGGTGPAPGGSAYDAAVLLDNPKHYWPLDDAVGSVEARDVVGAAPGVHRGGITLGQPGIGDGSTSTDFDGAAGISVPGFTFVSRQPFSVEVWSRPRVGGTYYALVTKTNGNYPAPFDWYGIGENAQTFFAPTSVAGALPLTAGVWHHLVATADEPVGTLTLYYHGEPETSGPAGDYVDADRPLQIGTRDDGGTAMVGQLAKVAFYDHVLTPAQVAAHYAAALAKVGRANVH